MFSAPPKRTLLAVTVAASLALALVPAGASAYATNWGFGAGGQKTATITWAPDDGQDVTAVVFTFPVKVKRASTRQGGHCTVPSRHPKQARCRISPAASFGYIDVVAKVRFPCSRPFKFGPERPGGAALHRPADV